MNKICYVWLSILLVGLIVSAFFNDAHAYDRVIMNMPNGTIVEAENVRIKDRHETWRITCEDGSVYIIAKENCVIFD